MATDSWTEADMIAAHAAVAKALREGRLVRPAACSRCPSTDRIQAHHPDYSKPLEVEWLCPKHHLAAHVVMRRHRVRRRPPAQPAGPWGLRVDEAAAYLGVSRETVERWTAKGRLAVRRLRAYRRGDNRRYRREDLDALLLGEGEDRTAK